MDELNTQAIQQHSLDTLISLLERHHQPLVELKEQIRPIAESITVLRFVGFSDTTYLRPYLKAITDSQRLIEYELNELRHSQRTTKLIFQRMVRSIMSEGQTYQDRPYNSIKQLATLVNPGLEDATEEKKEKAAEHLLNQYRDSEGIQQIAQHLAQDYLFDETNASRLPREVIKTYFTFITKEHIIRSFFMTPYVHFLYLFDESSNNTAFEMKTYGPNRMQELRKESSLDSVLGHAFSIGEEIPHTLHMFGVTEPYQKKIQSALRSKDKYSFSFH